MQVIGFVTRFQRVGRSPRRPGTRPCFPKSKVVHFLLRKPRAPTVGARGFRRKYRSSFGALIWISENARFPNRDRGAVWMPLALNR